jgi:hypothetical protein
MKMTSKTKLMLRMGDTYKIRAIMLFLLILLMTGCTATSKVKPSIAAVYESWIGAPVELLIDIWGNPEKISKSKDGKYTYYHYDKSELREFSYNGPKYIGGGKYVQGKNTSWFLAGCYSQFTVDSGGFIVEYQLEGDNKCLEGMVAPMPNTIYAY